MSLKNKIIGFIIIILGYLSSCANQSSPTGGPKDEDPPVLIFSTPEHESLNNSSTTILLQFNEAVKLKNPKEEIIITPRLHGEYNIKSKKRKVTLEIEDTLSSNTTYTFNFREAIQDLNEGNSPPNLQIAFSTGDYLDSLTISGSVHHLLTNESGKNITISLYDATDTLDVFNSPPIYFTKSDTASEFLFNNLKNGSYHIYAINDKNKNLLLESKTEQYAYLAQSIQLDSNVSKINLPLISLDVTPLKLQRSRVRGHYFVSKYNKYVASYTLRSLSPDQVLPYSSFSDDHKEINYYNTHTIDDNDSLGLVINAYDTINKLSVDTIYVKFEETKRQKNDFNILHPKVSMNIEYPEINMEIKFSKPVLHFNLDSIYFHVDSTLHIPFDTLNFTWNNLHTALTINKSLNPAIFETSESDKDTTNLESKKSNIPSNSKRNNKNSILYFGKDAFRSIEQDSSEFHTEKVYFTNSGSTGTILLQIETLAKSFYVQLISSQQVVISEKYNEKEISFDNIPSGTYKIRVLHDSNENKKWELGNITENLLPEPVIFYKSEEEKTNIILRARWEIGPIIIKF